MKSKCVVHLGVVSITDAMSRPISPMFLMAYEHRTDKGQ